MFINREVMIHIELHHRDNLAEGGNEFAEKTRFIHTAKDCFGAVFGSHHIKKQPNHFRIFTKILVDQFQGF